MTGGLGEFLAMDGYAMYVWPAVAVFIVVLAIDFVAPGFRQRRTLKAIRAKLRRQHGKRGS